MRDQSRQTGPERPPDDRGDITVVLVDTDWRVERWLVGSDPDVVEWPVAGESFWDLMGGHLSGGAEADLRAAMGTRGPVQLDISDPATGQCLAVLVTPTMTGASLLIRLRDTPDAGTPESAATESGEPGSSGPTDAAPGAGDDLLGWVRTPLASATGPEAAAAIYRAAVERLVEAGGYPRVSVSVMAGERLLVAEYAGYTLIDVVRSPSDPGVHAAIVAGRPVRVLPDGDVAWLAEDSVVAIHVPFHDGPGGDVVGVITVEWPTPDGAGPDDIDLLAAFAGHLSEAIGRPGAGSASVFAAHDPTSGQPSGTADSLLAEPAADRATNPDDAPAPPSFARDGQWPTLERIDALLTRQWDPASGRWPLSGMSDRIQLLSGYAADDILADPARWLAAVHPEDRSQAMMAQALAPEVGQRSQAAYRFRRDDGTWRLFNEDAVVFRDSVGALVNATLVTDITEDRQMIELLHESETRYRYLVDDLPGVVAYIREYDPRFGTLRTSYISSEIVSLTGIQSDVWIRDNIAIIDMVHPDDVERVEASRRTVIGHLRDYTHEYRIVRPDGEVRWIRNRVRHIERRSGADGERWHGVMIDITSQRAAEAALQDREAQYRLLVEQSPSATLYTQQVNSATGRVTTSYLSPQVVTLTGYALTSHHRPDPPFLSLVHPDDHDLVVANLPDAATVADRLSVDYRIIHRSGRTRWMRNMVHREPVEGPGAPITWRGIVIDITDQRVAEEAARAEDVRLRAVVEQGSEIVLITDRSRRISFASPALETVLGYGIDRIDRLSLSRVIHPDQLDEVNAAFEGIRVTPGSRIVSLRARVRHANRSWRWMELSAANKEDVPAIGGIVITARDVTDQVLAEESLRFRESLLGTLVQHAADFIAVLGPDLLVSYASPSAMEFAGMTTALPTVLPNHLFTPEQRDRFLAALTSIADQPRESAQLEERIQRADGQPRWVSITLTNHLETPGIQGYLLNAHDMTDYREAEQRLRDSEERFQALFRYAPDIVMVLDPDGFVQFASPSVEIALGDSIKRFVDRETQLNFHPDDYGMAIEQFDRALEHPSEGVSFEARVHHRSGAWLWWEITVTNLLKHPSVGGLVLNARDVTWRKDAEGLLRESEERFRSLVQHGSDLTLLVSERGVVTFVTASSQRILGYEPVDMVGKVDFEWINRSDRSRFDTLLADSRRHAEPVGPIVVSFRHADGTMRDLQIIATSLLDDQSVRGIVINAHDVTERRTLEQRLIHQASHDPLTGLPNRALFHQRLAEARERSTLNETGFAVIFLDLDDFKVINDTLGHAAGDQLLRTVGDRLSTIARDDDLVARMGGDEFTIVIEELADVASATAFADRVIARLQEPVTINGHEVLVSPCLGIAVGRPHDTTDHDLLREADIAMYEAKTRGKGQRVVYDDAVNALALARMQTQADLRQAVSAREFQVHYQPQVELTTGRIIEFEALVRWEHPTRGMISPLEIIPVAEETGLIVPLGQFVLEQACTAARGWNRRRREHGMEPLVVGVNLSARQFLHPTLVEDVTAILTDTGLEPRFLRLEITESVALNDLESTVETMRALRELGVSLAIDDFGTGYSGLNYLRECPIDTIKIDRSYINGLGTDSSDTAMIHAVMAFATTLGLDVCAEGIEREEQVAQLRGVGCHRGQGFYFSGPLPEDTITAMLETDSLWSLGFWDGGEPGRLAGD